MARIKEWPDGYLLSMDSRREDPLFYYMKEDDWEHAIGLEVLPLYEERTALRVSISVWEGHRDREAALTARDREQMYVRSLSALAAYHDRWGEIRLVAEDIAAVLESGAMANELKRLGFSMTPSSIPDSVTWTRD
ncbi:MAG: hypothetical protein M8861_13295 [marine benthic group bacterium]|nr:hypothetical protein [Gemmatimonadota bacterium]